MQYYLHTRRRPDRRGIKLEWIERVVAAPIKRIVQTDVGAFSYQLSGAV